MVADLQMVGISFVSNDFLHIEAKGGASIELQFFSRMAGNPSGPGAALLFKLVIASASSESLNFIWLSDELMVL